MSQFFQHHLLHHHFHYTEIRELYVSLSLRAFALGVGGLFVPLFLYDIGYSLAMIAGFYAVTMFLRAPLHLLSAILVSRLGVKHTLITSYVFLIVHLLVMFFIPHVSWLWAIAAVTLALEMALFWMAYHYHISGVRSRRHASSQVGNVIILRRLSMALGPLVGGVVAATFGVEYTLMIAATILLAAGYPLLKTPDTRVKISFDIKHINLRLKDRDSLAHISWQVSGLVAAYLWPLWLLLVLGEYEQIGFIIALSVVLGVGLMYWVGKLGDTGNNDRLLRIGGGIKTITHIIRPLSDGFGVALFTNISNDLGDNFMAGPFAEKFYEAADMGGRFLYVLRVEIINSLGKGAGWVVFLLLALIVDGLLAIQIMFILAAICMPAIIWVSARELGAT